MEQIGAVARLVDRWIEGNFLQLLSAEKFSGMSALDPGEVMDIERDSFMDFQKWNGL